MCKMLIMSGITDETKDNAWMFCKAMAKEMSSPNCGEKDGFGYAAIDDQGNLFGERWVNNANAFKHQYAYGTEIDSRLMKQYKILTREKIYGNFGVHNDNIRTITMHSRSATGNVSYKNTHPFVDGFTSVIHNGVIYNDDKLTKKYSTCDSEVILHEYIKYNIANRPGKIKKFVNRLEGYYALGILSKTNEGKVILDVIKDNAARLEAFFIKELNTVVFATPKANSSPVEEACKTLGFTIVSKYDVKPNRLIRMDALTGEVIAYESFKPREFTRQTYVNPTVWRGDYSDGEYGYPYDGYKNYTPPSKDKNFHDVFSQPNLPAKIQEKNNIIDMTTHSKAKHEVAVKERKLEDMILSYKEYTKEEVERMISGEGGIIDNLEDVTKNFNDGGESEWYKDDKLTWHKKSNS